MMMLLEDRFRANDLICGTCGHVYRQPHVNPTTKQVKCRFCWSNPNSCELWSDYPKRYRIEQIELQWRHDVEVIADDDEDWKDEVILSLVHQQNWTGALPLLQQRPKRKWNNMARYILTDCCSYESCPGDIISALLNSGVNTFEPKACINPFGVGAFFPVDCAAQSGNVDALIVLIGAGLCCTKSLFAMSLAAERGFTDVLELLWPVRVGYWPGHDYEWVETTLGEEANDSYLFLFASENGHFDKVFKAVRKLRGGSCFPRVEKIDVKVASECFGHKTWRFHYRSDIVWVPLPDGHSLQKDGETVTELDNDGQIICGVSKEENTFRLFYGGLDELKVAEYVDGNLTSCC